MYRIKQYITTLIPVLFVFFLCCFSSCKDEIFSSDPNHRLSFSVDTLSFDTVFSTITSSTKRIMVRNTNSKALRINEIGLAAGSSSVFRINVDGEASANNRFQDIEISAKDSMYLFVSVNVEELNQDSPLFIEEQLFFQLNGSTQQIVLETFGQDVEIFRGKTILNDSTLTASKPYIIYDSLAIISEKTLTLAAGCRLYFHKNADLYVYGNLHAEGTAASPIVLRGDRFDKINFSSPIPYNDVAGQWGGLYLIGNGTHKMKHVNINSGSVGVYLKPSSAASSIPDVAEMPKLDIVNCKIHNFLFYGLAVQNADVTVLNSEISNTGSYSVYLNGGNHTFVHTTIANYFNSGVSALQPKNRDNAEPAVMIMNLERSAPMTSRFLNCVIAGSFDNEFSLATRFPEHYEGTFRNTYIKRSTLDYLPFQPEDTILFYEKNDTIFKSTVLNYERKQYYNFEPDSVSPLRRLADPDITYFGTYSADLLKDLNGVDRTKSDKPAAGAYEWTSKIEN